MQPLVQKMRVPVRVIHGDEKREGSLVLRTDTESGRPETLLELLNTPQYALPFIEPDETVVLLTRLNVGRVETAPGVEAHLVQPSLHSITRKQRVELRFVAGAPLEGTIQWEAAKQHLRVLDQLNGEHDFFALQTESGLMIVNRRRVLETRLVGMPGL